MKNLETNSPAFVLRFNPLSDACPALSFPCDAAGRVDLDSLGERARCNYFYARVVIGRQFGLPAVQPGARLIPSSTRGTRQLEHELIAPATIVGIGGIGMKGKPS